MKTKIKLDIHSAASTGLIGNFATIIANHNAGLANVSLETFAGYFEGWCAMIPYKEATVKWNIGSSVDFSIDGKTPFVTIAQEAIIKDADMAEATKPVNFDGASYTNHAIQTQPPTPLSPFTTNMDDDEENEILRVSIGGSGK